MKPFFFWEPSFFGGIFPAQTLRVDGENLPGAGTSQSW